MTRSQQRQGAVGENRATIALRQVGVCMVDEITTPSIVRGGKVIYTKKVRGDRRGILENGISVLAEVKTTTGDRNLQWSDMRPHQPKDLTEHAEYNGLSLLVWVTDDDVYVMDWKDALYYGFQEGGSIDRERAGQLHKINDDWVQAITQDWRSRK